MFTALKSEVFLKCICMAKLGVYSSVTEVQLLSLMRLLLMLIVNGDLQIYCQISSPLTLFLSSFLSAYALFSSLVNKMPQMLAVEILRDVAYYFYRNLSLLTILPLD